MDIGKFLVWRWKMIKNKRKKVIINGISTEVILPKGMNPRYFPSKVDSFKRYGCETCGRVIKWLDQYGDIFPWKKYYCRPCWFEELANRELIKSQKKIRQSEDCEDYADELREDAKEIRLSEERSP